ncbi:MAG TPA: hypothetical protein VD863_04670 [Bradyrhizobium sp.]|nr:hypothetical protein [Bradyrhizobium sp.]
MSRRITLLVLAASAALIATQASADPECFGDTCHLPEVAEPQAATAQAPDADEFAASEVTAPPPVPVADAAVPQPAAVKVLPQVVTVPLEEEPQPMARRPLPPAPTPTPVAEVSVPAKPARLLPRHVKDAAPSLPVRALTAESPAPAREMDKAPTGYARSSRVPSPDPTYVVGYNAAPAAGIVVVVPGAVYGSGRYMFAPNAKIISIDNED